MADQLGRSVGDMYKGAIIPGLVLTGLYMGYVFLATMIYPKSAPALPLEARTARFRRHLPLIVALAGRGSGRLRGVSAISCRMSGVCRHLGRVRRAWRSSTSRRCSTAA